MNRKTIFLLSLSLALTGCGDDDRSDTDASVDTDTGPGEDRVGPTILEATPEDGSEGVAADTDFVAVFSEDIATEGSVDVTVEGAAFDADVSLDGDTLTVSAADGWPGFSEVEVRLGMGFADEAGNTLDRGYAFRFTTADASAPTVTATTPTEGDTMVQTRIAAVRIRFSEAMDQAAGSVTLEGGAGTIDTGRAEWSTFEVVYPIEGLENATDYRIVLDGFRDRTGNALDTSALGDDAIDFTTRPDDEGPRVVSSTPAEGQLDVLLETLAGTITVTFDEPMDTTIDAAPLTVDGTTTTDVPITWDDDTTATFATAGAAVTEAMHSLDLNGLTDVAGNALDPEPVVGDGRLDFITGIDAFVPYVAASSPAEGTTDLSFPMTDVVMAFSESMDTSITEIPVRDEAGGDRLVTGAWSAGGTVLTLAGSEFEIGLVYEVDVTGLTDLAGTAVSPSHPYLGEGILDFEVEDPTGESCDLALRTVDGTEVSPGVTRFEISGSDRTRNNGSAPCDPDGIADTDAVIHYVKTTPALDDPSGNGRALRIFTDDVTNRVNVDVLAGVCDPMDAGADAARQVCFTGHDTVDQLLDVPAGDYFIWVSTADSSGFGIDVEVSEVETIPQGESCRDPYDQTSPEYTAPATVGEAHVWDLPAATYNSLDISRSNAPFAANSCTEDPFGDVVIAYEKTDPDTVLDVTVASNGFPVAGELIEGACTRVAGGATAACDPSMGSSGDRFSAAVGAGTHYQWLSGNSSGNPFPGADVSIRELPAPTAPGSSCASAIDITPTGTVAITPDHANRYFAPSCTPTTSNVTWYAFESTATLTRIAATGDGAIGLLDAASGTELGCDDGTSPEVSRFAPVGTRVCLAVETDGSVTELTFENIDYTGPGITPPTSLEIDAPPDFSGTTYEGFSIAGDSYMAVTPTTLWQNFGTAGMLSAPKTGGVPIDFDLQFENLGNGGTHIGESVFTIDFNGGGGRIQRLTDATGAKALAYMDPGADYPENTRALTTDGTFLYTTVQEGSSSATRDFPVYRIDPSAPGVPEVIGRIDTIYNLTGLAMDATHLYVTGQTASSQEGVYRVALADLSPDATTTPELVHFFGSELSTTAQPMTTLSVGGNDYLYVRDDDGQLHVIADPAGTPVHLGVLVATDPADVAFDIDETGALYVFGMHLEPEGQWYRYDPL